MEPVQKKEPKPPKSGTKAPRVSSKVSVRASKLAMPEPEYGPAGPENLSDEVWAKFPTAKKTVQKLLCEPSIETSSLNFFAVFSFFFVFFQMSNFVDAFFCEPK